MMTRKEEAILRTWKHKNVSIIPWTSAAREEHRKVYNFLLYYTLNRVEDHHENRYDDIV